MQEICDVYLDWNIGCIYYWCDQFSWKVGVMQTLEKTTKVFTNVEKKILPQIVAFAQELGVTNDNILYKSKYNKDVVYDYEPFCTDSFDISVQFSSHDKATIQFLQYLIEDYVDKVNVLESMYINS